MSDLVERAEGFAREEHQFQLYGDLPYAVHLEAVVRVLLDAGIDDEDLIAAAWLHDIVEDTDVCALWLHWFFGPTVAALVWCCTGEGENRKERNGSIYRKIDSYRLAATVKTADRIANVEHSSPGSKHRSMYRKERAAFWLAVARYAPKSLQERLDAAYDKD